MEFGAPSVEFYIITDDCHQISSETADERGTMRGELLINVADSPFKGGDMTRAMVTTLFLDSLAIAVVIFFTIIFL